MSNKQQNELKEKVDRIYRLLFDEDNPDQRSIYDDLVLLRLIYNRLKSAKFIIGVLVGMLTVGAPAIFGIFKLIMLIKASFNH